MFAQRNRRHSIWAKSAIYAALTILSFQSLVARAATYDDRGRSALTITNAVGETEARTYDPRLGVVMSFTDANKVTTTWTHDSLGLQTGEVQADAILTRRIPLAVPGSSRGITPGLALEYWQKAPNSYLGSRLVAQGSVPHSALSSESGARWLRRAH